jgi:hypothetical protein
MDWKDTARLNSKTAIPNTGMDSAWEQRKLEARKMLVNGNESPAYNAPQKIVSNHFIRENATLFRQEVQKKGRFSKKCVFLTVSRLHSENAMLAEFLEDFIVASQEYHRNDLSESNLFDLFHQHL